MLSDEEISEQLAWNLRAARVRAVYHRAMGETIVFRLTFDGAPDFTITEDIGAETVTVSLPSVADPLTLHVDVEGREPQADYDALRSWIEQHVNIGALPLRKHSRTGSVYWRRHPARHG